MCNNIQRWQYTSIVRKVIGVNEHQRLFNFTLKIQIKVKKECMYEKFEDTKGVIRIRKSNGQKEKQILYLQNIAYEE